MEVSEDTAPGVQVSMVQVRRCVWLPGGKRLVPVLEVAESVGHRVGCQDGSLMRGASALLIYVLVPRRMRDISQCGH